MVKKGDTLIEVALAIGIFSMVAIAVVAVMSGGTSSSQTALETTLAREEIDAQAEALRFIHSAYLADEYSGDAVYASLWNDIISNAIEIGQNGIDASVLQYNPTTCEDIRENSNLSSKAFVINTHALATDPSKAYVTGDFLQPASTYPRLIYDHAPDTESLIDSATISSADLYRAEGIYVIAVKDPGNTQMVSGDSSQVSATSAYYDFYIRTCWYGAGADQASTISTVVRLYNPPEVSEREGPKRIYIKYYSNRGTVSPGTQTVFVGETANFANPPLGMDPSEFLYWQKVGSDVTYVANEVIPTDNIDSNEIWNLEAVWKRITYSINYDANGGSFATTTPSGSCVKYESCNRYTIDGERPTRSGYKFSGWCTVQPTISNGKGECSGAKYSPGGTFEVTANTTLYAIWDEDNKTLKIYLTWSGSGYSDLDSYVTGQRSDGSTFTAYYSNKIGSDTSGLTIAELDRDCTGSCTYETFIINTLGGKNYYYYVRNYSSDSSINSNRVTVTVSEKNSSGGWDQVQTYSSNNASGHGRIWNVFAYKDGRIVTRQTRSSNAETSY